MVQTVVIPLSVLNALPGLTGIEDVQFSVPELDDITDEIVANTLDRTDLDEALTDAIDDIVAEVQQATVDADALADRLVEEVEQRVSEIVISPQEVADLVVDQLNLEDLVTDQVSISGIFGPLTEDVVRAFEEVLNEVLGAIDDLPEGIDSVTQSIDQVLTDTETLIDRLPADVQATVEDGVEAVLADLGLSEFLDDPVTWFLDRLEASVQERIDPETQQAVEEATFLEPPP